jgi:hypothetical protein
MSVERQGRSVRALGLGDIIYKHGWLVKKGKGRIHLYQPNSAGFGTLIKERIGSQPTDRGGKAGHAAGHPRLHISEVWRKARISNAIARPVGKTKCCREEKTKPRTYLEVASIAS